MDADSLTDLITASDLPAFHHQTISRDLPTAPTTLGHTPLHWAALSDTPSILSLLLANATTPDPLATAPDQGGQTPLQWACVSGPLINIITLLSHRANPAICDHKGYNAVTHAAQYGRVDVLHLLLTNFPNLSSSLDNQGHTPLMWTCYYDHHPAAVYLLNVCQVPVDDVDNSGMTALHRAAQSDSDIMVDTLLRYGADWRIPDNEGRSIIDVATGRTRLLLQEWDADRLTKERPVRQRRDISRFALVAFYYILLAVSYWRYWPIRYNLGIGVTVVAHIAMAVSVFSHIKTTCSDPGDLTKGNRNTFTDYIEKCLKEGVSETRLLPSAFCFSCLTVRPLRSKHSRERDVCVRRFDHECPWVNNTVGLHTHRSLMLLALSTATAESCFITAVGRVIHVATMESSLIDAVLAYPLLFVLACLHCAVCIFCIALFITHIHLVALGRTTYEHLVATRENVTQNPYDRGVWSNIIAFLTLSGPGTGKPWVEISARTIRQVVLSNDGCSDRKVDEEQELLAESTTTASDTKVAHACLRHVETPYLL